MKKIVLILLLSPLSLLAQKDIAKGFIIKGDITGIPDKTVISLVPVEKTTDTIARGVSQKNQFTLTGEMNEPGLYYLVIPGSPFNSMFFFGNEKITINGNKDSVQKMIVKGSVVHADYQSYVKIFSPYFERVNNLISLIKSGYSNKTDSLQAASVKLFDSIEKRARSFIQEKPASPVAALLALVITYNAKNVTLASELYNIMKPAVQNSFYGGILKNMVDDGSVGAIGSFAMDFTQDDTLGKPVKLSEYKGKYVLIDFWASWCGPCRMENPNVVAAFNKFRKKNFTILGVSLDRDKQKWIDAIHKDGLDWTHVSDLKFWGNEVAQLYRIQSIPQNLLVDPQGKIVGKNLRGTELDVKLCQLLGCN